MNKKASIILVLKILEEYSDEIHYLTQKEIALKIKEKYDLVVERKSIGSSLLILKEVGYDIHKSSKGGYALIERTFDKKELVYIVDALFTSKSLSAQLASDITKKLTSDLSIYKRKSFSYIHKANDNVKAGIEDIFVKLELIEEAKKRHKQISFQYVSYNESGEKEALNDGKRFIVSPYYTVVNNGRYFLVANYQTKSRQIQWFRIDYILNLKIEDTLLIPIKSLKGMKKFDIDEFLNQNVYLLNSDAIETILEIEDEKYVKNVVDFFHKNAMVYTKDDKIIAKVKCNESAMFYWYMQSSKGIKIISPDSLVKRVKKEVVEIAKKYK